jgi:hypothetical protein
VPEEASYYQELIGVLRWSVELGRIDIHTSVAMLSQHLAMPRREHLNAAYDAIKKHLRYKIVFDDTYIHWDNKFKKVAWTDFYPEAEEPIPPTIPEPRGNEAQTNAFVDADHAGNKVTRRSHTGILIFLNKANPLAFQTTETSTFGSEFVGMRTCTVLIQGIRYKLRMMGVPIDGPANVCCGNEAVVRNTSAPESTLKKKHVAVCYHGVREACASGMIRIAKEDTKKNLADCLTTILSGPTLKGLLTRLMY